MTKTPVTPTNRQELTSVGNQKIGILGYERREQKIVLKCDTFQKKRTKKMQIFSHSTHGVPVLYT